MHNVTLLMPEEVFRLSLLISLFWVIWQSRQKAMTDLQKAQTQNVRLVMFFRILLLSESLHISELYSLHLLNELMSGNRFLFAKLSKPLCF